MIKANDFRGSRMEQGMLPKLLGQDPMDVLIAMHIVRM